MTTFFAGAKIRASELEALLGPTSPLPLGVLARSNRTTSSSTTTTEGGVTRIDDIPIYLGRVYKIWTSPLALSSTVANDDVAGRIRITTDGSTPSTSSTQIAQVQDSIVDTSNLPEGPLVCKYVPTADELLSVFLTVARAAGTGNASILGSSTRPIDLVVEDMGLDPGDTGVDS